MPKKPDDEPFQLNRTSSLLDEMFEEAKPKPKSVRPPAAVARPRQAQPLPTTAQVAFPSVREEPARWVKGKRVRQAWDFLSSNGRTEYETLLYIDGTLSCNCQGWTRRTLRNGQRECKHTLDVTANRAQRTSLRTRHYH